MLRFKQYLIEKVKHEMNTPMDLADFPEDESISLNSITIPNIALKPVKYTRSSRDEYNEALKKHNDEILEKNKKYGLNNPIDETSFEDAVGKTRKEFERLATDPNNNADPYKQYKTVTMAPPKLGGTGWADVLRPDNPADSKIMNSLKVDNPFNNLLINSAKDVWNGFDYLTKPIDTILFTGKLRSRKRERLNDPLWSAHHEAGLKQERNKRLGVSPSVANPLETGNYFDSPEYFDRIEATAQNIYDNNYSGYAGELSPFDMVSLQFGKDKTKERNEFLQKQKEYLIRSGSDQSSENNQAKLARTYGDLRDPSYDEKVLYEPIEINSVIGGKTLGWTGQTTAKDQFVWKETLGAIIDKQNKKQKQAGVIPSSSSVQQDIQKDIDYKMRINPELLKPKIDLNKDNIRDWEKFISVLSHEAHHALAVPEAAKSRLENIINRSNNQEIRYKSPATIKYGLEPSISGMTLGSGYEELEKRKLADSFKNHSKNEIKSELDKHDIPGPGVVKGIPSSYYWDRGEMPAFMKQLKLNLFNKTGNYPTSDETDEEIEQDRDTLYNMSPKDIRGPLSYLKALEFMKTPEGKAIWRGVQKTTPKKDIRYT